MQLVLILNTNYMANDEASLLDMLYYVIKAIIEYEMNFKTTFGR